MNIVLFEAEELTDPPPGSPAPPGASVPRARQPAASSRAVRLPAGPRSVRLPAADRRARHIIDVLRLGPGDQFRAGIVDGPAGQATLAGVDADESLRIDLAGIEAGATGKPGGARPRPSGPDSAGASDPTSLHPVRLLLGHPRPIVLRRMLRDLSTLGVECIVAVRTELGEKSYLKSNLWEGDTVRGLLIEGAEQAGSTMLPRVDKAWRLADAIARVVEGREGAPRVVFDNEATGEAAAAGGPGGAGGPRAAAGPGRIIAVGSERGWTDDELHLLRDNGFEIARLGERILRTETAAIAAVVVTLRDLGIV
jgi:16S rRNA U1498 N3-methylase RsmE